MVDLGSFVVDSEKVYQEKVEAETKVSSQSVRTMFCALSLICFAYKG